MNLVFDKFSIDIWPLGLFTLVIILFVLFRKGKTQSYLICFSLFWVYLMYVARVTLFPIPLTGGYADSLREYSKIWSKVNLIPFYFGTYRNSAYFIIGIIGNIFLTVPFGFGLKFISQKKNRNAFWVAVVVGLGIELIQLMISFLLGYQYRVLDVNDAILNFLGVLLGYWLFRIFAWVYLKLMNRIDLEKRGFGWYLYNVVKAGE